MESESQTPFELRLYRVQDQLKAHETMIYSMQTVIERQQKMIERLTAGNISAPKPSILENFDMEKLAKIALFAFSLNNEETESEGEEDN
ncbi:hypothetical protein D3H55_09555 [Bacillus salacetis]|uniref:Uncharacterized protein n=1 Tax=Bacillus salacetis TaxID=2315464 RepID=A0A3A1QZM8_9BACI|nr:hypothetical protein [Bacillus salacetis]RIW34746.1 hypothetical protein D3H55_09555 [Bacillus salacetis]